MRFLLPLPLLLLPCAFSQQVPVEVITNDTVVATVNGRKFTAGDLENLTRDLNPQARELAANDPKAFLENWAYSQLLTAEAERMKLQDRQPFKRRIEDARNQILIQAILGEQTSLAKVTPESVRQAYDDHKADYKQAKVKVIFLSRFAQVATVGSGETKAITAEEMKAKAETAAKKARSGADFLKVAKDFSDDPATADNQADFPYPIRAGDATVPEDIRKAVLAAQPGDIVGPIEHQTGHYIFRVESQTQATFDQVKSEIEKRMRDAAVQEWLDAMKKKTSVSLDHQPFWQAFTTNAKQIIEKEKAAASSGTTK
jgi:parvulin-like peptidyl-prolyl isomerase